MAGETLNPPPSGPVTVATGGVPADLRDAEARCRCGHPRAAHVNGFGQVRDCGAEGDGDFCACNLYQDATPPDAPASEPAVRPLSERIGARFVDVSNADGYAGCLFADEVAALEVELDKARNERADAIKAAVTAANNRAADAFREWREDEPGLGDMHAIDFEAWLRSGEDAPGAATPAKETP